MIRNILIIIVVFFSVNKSFSQSQDSSKIADAAVKIFTWDIQKSEKGALMFLDVPYLEDNKDTTEYLSLTVAKDKSKERPDFISVIIPNNIVQANGIFIKFANTIENKMVLEKGNPVRINFEGCNNEDCTARIIEGYAYDEKTKEKIDIFQKFLASDHVLFLFIYPNGTHKSVAVPLFSFKQQYKTL